MFWGEEDVIFCREHDTVRSLCALLLDRLDTGLFSFVLWGRLGMSAGVIALGIVQLRLFLFVLFMGFW